MKRRNRKYYIINILSGFFLVYIAAFIVSVIVLDNPIYAAKMYYPFSKILMQGNLDKWEDRERQTLEIRSEEKRPPIFLIRHKIFSDIMLSRYKQLSSVYYSYYDICPSNTAEAGQIFQRGHIFSSRKQKESYIASFFEPYGRERTFYSSRHCGGVTSLTIK